MKKIILSLLLCVTAYAHADIVKSDETDNVVKKYSNSTTVNDSYFNFIDPKSLFKWLDYKIDFMENLTLLNLKNELGKVEFNSYRLNYTIIKKQDPLFSDNKNSSKVEDTISKSHMVVTDFKYVESSISNKTPYISSAFQIDNKPVEYVKDYIESGLNFRVIVFPAPKNKDKVIFIYSFILSNLESIKKITEKNITIELPTVNSISSIGEMSLDLNKEVTVFKNDDYELLIEIIPTTSVILETPLIFRNTN